MASDGHKETLRKMLRERVPPYLNNKLVHDLCEDVIETFGSLYPDQALNLCMRVAQKLSASGSGRRGRKPVARRKPTKHGIKKRERR